MNAAELLQPAEEISGPEGDAYLFLMDDVAHEAARRARVFVRENDCRVGRFFVKPAPVSGWKLVDGYGGDIWQTRVTFDRIADAIAAAKDLIESEGA